MEPATRLFFVQCFSEIGFPAPIAVSLFGHAHTAVDIVAYVHMFKPDKVHYSVTEVGKQQMNDCARAATTAIADKTSLDYLPLPSLLRRELRYFGEVIAKKVQ